MDSNKLVAFVIISIIILLGLVGITTVRWHDIKGSFLISRESLQQTPGIINSSKIECYSGRNGRLYRFAIVYNYNVDREKFVSDSVSFSQGHALDEQTARQYVEKYPVGKNVPVFYKIDEHSFSALEPENKDLFLSVIFIIPILMFVLLVYFIKKNVYLGRFQKPFIEKL